MEFIREMLSHLGDGAQLIVTYQSASMGRYHALISDGDEVLDAYHRDMDEVVKELNQLAEEWLLEQEDDEGGES